MNLELFLKTLINKLESEGIKYCILRNYETLPKVLKKGDIDFLISEEHILKVKELIASIQDIHIIGVTKRKYVHNYFLYNIDKGGESRALQIDFVFDFTYRGLSYIDSASILENIVVMPSKQFYISTKFDETFLMFLPFYLATGTLNRKYDNMVISVFQDHEEEFRNSFLKLRFEKNFITKFYNAILDKNDRILKQIWNRVKRKVFFENFAFRNILSHYLIEIKLRLPFINASFVKVSLNPQNIDGLSKSLDSYAKNILFLDLNRLRECLKIFKIQSNFTMYVLYKKVTEISKNDTINEVVASMPIKAKDERINEKITNKSK